LRKDLRKAPVMNKKGGPPSGKRGRGKTFVMYDFRAVLMPRNGWFRRGRILGGKRWRQGQRRGGNQKEYPAKVKCTFGAKKEEPSLLWRDFGFYKGGEGS